MNQTQSETIGKIAESLSKAQGKFKTAVKDKQNPHFRSSYASYESVREACQSALSAEGIAITHQMIFEEGKRVMLTQLTHVSGEWLRSYLALPADKETPQGIGSALSYGMRYSLSSMLCIPSGDGDDDGEKAEEPYRPAEIKKTNGLIHPSQAKHLEDLIGNDVEFMTNVLQSNKVSKLTELPANLYEVILNIINKRKAK